MFLWKLEDGEERSVERTLSQVGECLVVAAQARVVMEKVIK